MAALGGVFLAGLSMGMTSCALHCSPVLFYVGASAEGWKDGLRSVLLFSLFRLLGITALGMLAGGIGALALDSLAGGSRVAWLRYAAAAIVVALGIAVTLGLNPTANTMRICRAMRGPAAKRRAVSLALLGLLIGITPVCPVFLGVLNYIAFGLESVALGALFAFTFGVGSALLTPLMAMGPLMGLASRVFSSPVRLQAFRRASGAILVVLGVVLFVNV
jgi:cytochrome c biogenesis protein CcdA